VDLARDLLDQQAVDRNGRNVGRVDGLILDANGSGRPRVAAIEMGPAVVVHRVWPRLGRVVAKLAPPLRIPAAAILAVTDRVKVDVASGETPAPGVRLEDLLGREVLASNNRAIGLLEEFRAEMRGDELCVMEYVIGLAGLLERLHVGARLLAGGKPHGYVARWDQLDISHPEKPRLTCPIEELRRR
jgi:sporulation protein YlmC with PRC-barrel domain